MSKLEHKYSKEESFDIITRTLKLPRNTELGLEASACAQIILAHIWTPHAGYLIRELLKI